MAKAETGEGNRTTLEKRNGPGGGGEEVRRKGSERDRDEKV